LSRANKELDLLYQQNLDHLKLTREELSYQELLAQTDELTGLYNRRCFDTQLKKFVELSLTSSEQFGLLILDLDNFKLANDTYGHPHGDFVLKEVAQVLRKSCRHTDLLSRMGGDEFAIIMPGISSIRGKEVAEKICRSIEALPTVDPESDFNVTASLGGTLHVSSESPNELIARVDKYLYRAKHNGRNQVVWEDNPS
jgi:diguanylate cyclase (GGDEF)-like protein